MATGDWRLATAEDISPGNVLEELPRWPRRRQSPIQVKKQETSVLQPGAIWCARNTSQISPRWAVRTIAPSTVMACGLLWVCRHIFAQPVIVAHLQKVD